MHKFCEEILPLMGICFFYFFLNTDLVYTNFATIFAYLILLGQGLFKNVLFIIDNALLVFAQFLIKNFAMIIWNFANLHKFAQIIKVEAKWFPKNVSNVKNLYHNKGQTSAWIGLIITPFQYFLLIYLLIMQWFKIMILRFGFRFSG